MNGWEARALIWEEFKLNLFKLQTFNFNGFSEIKEQYFALAFVANVISRPVNFPH